MHNITTMIAKATTDLNAKETYPPKRFSMIPSKAPPTAVPGRLVIPPKTAEANPFKRGSIIIGGSSTPRAAMSIPATAPTMELMAQVKERIHLVRMPMTRAANGFC